MEVTDLMNAIHRKEFLPANLHFSDGSVLRLPHPDYFMLFPTKESALVFPDGKNFEIVDVASIVRIVPVGKRKRGSH